MLPSTLLLDKRLENHPIIFNNLFKYFQGLVRKKLTYKYNKLYFISFMYIKYVFLLCILHSIVLTACQAGVFSEQKTWTQKRSKHRVESESKHLVVQSTSNFDSTTWKKHKIVPDENIPVFTFCAQVMNFLKHVWIIEYSRQNFLSKNYSVSRTFVTEN